MLSHINVHMRSGQSVFCSPSSKHPINVLVQPLHQLKERYSASKVVIGEKYLAVTRIAICLLVQYFSYNYKWQNSSNSVTHLSKHIKSQCCPYKLQKTEEMYWLTEKNTFSAGLFW